MCFKENLWIDPCPNEFTPVFYKYIDDAFVLFRCKSRVQKFHEYLNNCHNNIKFTMEFESNDRFPFLDFNFSRDGGNFMSSVCRKPTFSGQGISYFSYMPFRLTLKVQENYFTEHRSLFTFSQRTFVSYELFFSIGFPVHLIEQLHQEFFK